VKASCEAIQRDPCGVTRAEPQTIVLVLLLALSLAASGAACGAAGEGAAQDTSSVTPTGSSAAGRAKRSAGPPSGEELVRLHLLADTSRIAAGQEFTLAARLDIEPGWHLYWINPGESGLPTAAKFQTPAGFEVGPVRYPWPVRFDSPGDITSYGYRDLAVLSSIVRAPDRLDTGARQDRLRFSVEASWLACREVCVRGQGVAAVDLPVATRAEPAGRAHAELFERHRDSLPRRFAELDGKDVSWRREERQIRLRIEVTPAQRLQYFPGSGEDLRLTGQVALPGQAAGGSARLELSYKPGAKPASARGVLAVTRADAIRYYQLDLTEVCP
jgi:thiol:disulfide interchange protein DsbD